MPSEDIISKLKKSGLTGRSGSSFPTGLKWESVKNIKSPKKYIICNATEGEPDVFKDDYILKNYPDKVIEGMKIALKTIDHSSGYIYINKEYFKKYGNKLIVKMSNKEITYIRSYTLCLRRSRAINLLVLAYSRLVTRNERLDNF